MKAEPAQGSLVSKDVYFETFAYGLTSDVLPFKSLPREADRN